MSHWVIVHGLCALVVTALLTFLAKRPAHLIGLVDRPGGRKHHEATVPLCGGPAIVIAFLSLVAILGALPSLRYVGLLAGVLVLTLVGCWDDLRDVRAGKRIVAQILVGLLCLQWFGQERLVNLGDLFALGDIQLGYAQIPFTLLCVVGVVNAVNLVDGVDGLAGGLTVIALNFFATAALAAGQFESFNLLVLLIGGTIGFLLFNLRTPWRKRASVFLGDSGSTALGFILCWFAVDLTQGRGSAISPIAAVWILALPIMDTVNVMVSRALRGHQPFRASRDHLHHALLAAGYTPRQTVWILFGIAAVMGGIGLAGYHYQMGEPLLCLGFIGMSIIYFFAMNGFWRRRYRQFIAGYQGSRPAPSFVQFMREPSAVAGAKPAGDPVPLYAQPEKARIPSLAAAPE